MPVCVCTCMCKHLRSPEESDPWSWCYTGVVRLPAWVLKNHLRLSAREVCVLKCRAIKNERFLMKQHHTHTHTDTIQIWKC